jgi:hypothetical protein
VHLHTLRANIFAHLVFPQLVVKVHAFQKQLDFILAAISLGGGVWVLNLFFPGLLGVFRFVLSVFETLGAKITTFLSRMLQRLRWRLSGFYLVGPSNPNYPVDFQSKLDKHAEHVMSLVSPPVNDDHFTSHGRVRYKLECCVRA